MRRTRVAAAGRGGAAQLPFREHGFSCQDEKGSGMTVVMPHTVNEVCSFKIFFFIAFFFEGEGERQKH